MHPAQQQDSWRKTELVLCVLFVLCKFFLIWKQWNVGIGFDWFRHVAAFPTFYFYGMNEEIYAGFYSYHPPLSFLFSKGLLWIGQSEILSVQLQTFFAMLVSFFAIRYTLRSLGLLYSASGIVFLYVSFSLPLNVFLSYSMNLDAWVFAVFSIVVLLSVKAFYRRHTREVASRSTFVLAISAVLALGLLTKFTVVLLLPIPLLALFCLGERPSRDDALAACCAVMLAVLCVLPYYYQRYYANVGEWFPSNTNHFDRVEQAVARKDRDADPTAFLLKLFAPAPTHTKGLQYRDLVFPRMSDTWKDVWVMDDRLMVDRQGETPALAITLGIVYARLSPFFLLFGLLLALRRIRQHDTWQRLGVLLFSCSTLLFLGLVWNVYQNPWAGSFANKFMYIAPATLGIGYLFAEVVRKLSPTPYAKIALATGLGAFMLIGHLVPVY